jgi:WhiB family transcriptional regulator, redox-sensing transcriptional regulator
MSFGRSLRRGIFPALPFQRATPWERAAAMDLTWKVDGACRWVEPELFFPVSDAEAGPAKRVCAACGVQQRCLDFAMEMRENEGVWGGLTGPERRALRRRRVLTA